MKVTWSKRAKKSLRGIVNYIKKDYPMAAERVRNKIFDTVDTIQPYPEKFSQEERLTEQGNIRYCVIWSYKIIYVIENDEISILDVFDTRQDPEKINDIIE